MRRKIVPAQADTISAALYPAVWKVLRLTGCQREQSDAFTRETHGFVQRARVPAIFDSWQQGDRRTTERVKHVFAGIARLLFDFEKLPGSHYPIAHDMLLSSWRKMGYEYGPESDPFAMMTKLAAAAMNASMAALPKGARALSNVECSMWGRIAKSYFRHTGKAPTISKKGPFNLVAMVISKAYGVSEPTRRVLEKAINKAAF